MKVVALWVGLNLTSLAVLVIANWFRSDNE